MQHVAVHMADVHKGFGNVRALDGVSLKVGAGVTGLLGPNGAGKTTMLRLIATALAPDRGTITLLGRDPAVAGDRVEIRRRLGYMPQEPGYYLRFTVFAFVDYVAILKGVADPTVRRDEVRRVLDDVDLLDVERRKVKSLSGGMRRRLALGVALLGSPDLLLLDEPTAGLDPEQRLRFRSLVSRASNHPAVMLSTHQTEDISALCDRVVVLDGGSIRFDGSPEALAESASGQVWIGDEPDGRAVLSWRMGGGRHRHIGDPPVDAELAQPSIDDAYLLMVHGTRVRRGAPA